MLLPFALLAAITFTPDRPTVGDPITVTFPAAVTVQPSPNYEVIAQRGNQVIVRTFEPKTFELHSSAGDIMIPVHSVLRQGDLLEPAPLKPPRPEPAPRGPFIAIAIAALAAVAAWAAVIALARRRMPKPEVVIDPAERFRRSVAALRGDRWAELADATRRYLAATDPRLGMELTTRELLARCHPERSEGPGWAGGAPPAHPGPSLTLGMTSEHTLAEILRQGDLEKFSPWGAAPGDFRALTERALALIPPETPAEEAAA